MWVIWVYHQVDRCLSLSLSVSLCAPSSTSSNPEYSWLIPAATVAPATNYFHSFVPMSCLCLLFVLGTNVIKLLLSLADQISLSLSFLVHVHTTQMKMKKNCLPSYVYSRAQRLLVLTLSLDQIQLSLSFSLPFPAQKMQKFFSLCYTDTQDDSETPQPVFKEALWMAVCLLKHTHTTGPGQAQKWGLFVCPNFTSLVVPPSRYNMQVQSAMYVSTSWWRWVVESQRKRGLLLQRSWIVIAFQHF